MAGPPSKPNQPIVCLEMTDKDVVGRAAKLFGTAVVKNTQRGDWQQTYSARLRGRNAVELMQKIRSSMGTRRREQIDRAVASYKDCSNKILDETRASQIRNRARAGEKMQALADEFGVSYCTVKKIKYGEIWRAL